MTTPITHTQKTWSAIPGDYKHCECADTGCPIHPGKACDAITNEVSLLYRVDMEDNSGVLFCSECAGEAQESGVFS